MADTPSKKPRQGAGRVAFLARLEQFQELLAAGNEQRTIYDDFGGEAELGISYSQFNRYVVRYITGAKDDGHQRKGTGQIAPPSPSQALQEPQEAKQGVAAPWPKTRQKRPGFQHNPNSGNDRDDLI